MTPQQACPFCERIQAGSSLAGNDLAVAFPDGFPLNPGHTLVVPTRHVSDYFALSPEEQTAIWSLVSSVKVRLDAEHAPAGYNVGINVAPAGGQTVWHAHVHLVPRYAGDVADPRGGVRWIVPARARYWKDE